MAGGPRRRDRAYADAVCRRPSGLRRRRRPSPFRAARDLAWRQPRFWISLRLRISTSSPGGPGSRRRTSPRSCGGTIAWLTRLARDTSFYYSFLVLPADKRRAIVAVWDFCRAVDDAVDEAPAEGSEAEVRRWREEVARCFDGGQPQTAQGRALQPLIAPFTLPRSAFEALVEGVEMDLHGRRYRDVRGALPILHPRRVGGRADVRRRSSAARIPARASTRSTSASRCS